MADKLYITISDERGGGTPTPKPEGAKEKNNNNDDILGRYVEHQMFNMVKSQATQFVNFSLGNIGNFTGDYIVQREVNEAKQLMSGFMNIGMSTLAGAKYGWVGAIVGFAVGTIGQISSSVYDRILTSFEVKKANYEIEQLRQLAGLNSTRDGSRGTEN